MPYGTYDWNQNNLGNLDKFEVPAFRTGEGLASILALKQRQQEQAQNFGADIGSSIGKQMEQRKRDEMYNVLMDNYSKEFGIENPFAGGGEKGYKAASELIKLRMLAQKQDLAERMGEARISRIGRASTGGGGGGGGGAAPETGEATGPDIVEKDGIKFEVKRTRNGIRYERLPGQTVGGRAAGGAAVKPRTQHQQDELYLDVESLRAAAEKEKAENITKLIPNKPFTRQHELNPRAKLLGVDPVTGEPIKTVAPAATPPPTTAEVGMGGTESTRIIEKNGHHYEVDDVTKTVIRQID